MYITSIHLENFRNYTEGDVVFTDKTNILYGDNAQGKTNILEAAYLSATTGSHRMSRDKDMIRFECEEAHITLNVMKRDVEHRIDMHLRKNKNKMVYVDRIPIKRTTELFGLINIIFFSPEDLSIVKEGPKERRRFMDMELCQLSRIYLNNLSDYNKVLVQRNNLLRSILYDHKGSAGQLMDTLDIWDEQLVQFGKRVISERKNFIDMLRDVVVKVHEKITGGWETIDIRYEPSVDPEEFSEALKKRRDQDLKYTATSVGPHRDDIGIYIDQNDVRTFGSQGQQRTAALTLKLAEIELVKSMISDTPILLLDDVMSELDEKRRGALIESLDGIQSIITCTGYSDFIRERMSPENAKNNRIFHVSKGTVEEVV